ncbi:hypothetical protein U3516DRAFT_739744 [Neocallimastix sp. 'constans']
MISRPYSTVEFYTTSTPNSVSSYCNNTLVLRVRDSYYKYQSVKRTEAPACPLAQASCTTRTSDSPTRLYVCRIPSGLRRRAYKGVPLMPREDRGRKFFNSLYLDNNNNGLIKNNEGNMIEDNINEDKINENNINKDKINEKNINEDNMN